MHTFDLRVSRLAGLGTLALHLSGLAAILLADINIWLTLALALALIYLGSKHLWAQLPAAPARIRRCRVSPQCWLLETSLQQRRYEPPDVVFMSELLIVLQFSWELDAAEPGRSQPQVLLVFPDSLSESQSKSLRRCLRFECR